MIWWDRSFIVINMKLLMPSFSFVVLHIFISLNTFKNVPKDFPSICALKHMSVYISASWNIYFSLLIIWKYRFPCLSMPVTFWLINLIKIYLIRILRGYLLRANTNFLKIIMILIYTSFMITDKMAKIWPFLADCPVNSALRHWRQLWLCFDVFTNLLLYWLDGSQNIHLWSHFSLAVFSTQSDMYINIHRTEECFYLKQMS